MKISYTAVSLAPTFKLHYSEKVFCLTIYVKKHFSKSRINLGGYKTEKQLNCSYV